MNSVCYDCGAEMDDDDFRVLCPLCWAKEMNAQEDKPPVEY